MATTFDSASPVSVNPEQAHFVAINYIHCRPEYIERFEELFKSRSHAIDRMPGFQHMHVLKPAKPEDPYLVVSYWASEADFRAWVGSPEFIEGHKRGFEDLKNARQAGEPDPMTSDFKTYDVLCR